MKIKILNTPAALQKMFYSKVPAYYMDEVAGKVFNDADALSMGWARVHPGRFAIPPGAWELVLDDNIPIAYNVACAKTEAASKESRLSPEGAKDDFKAPGNL